MSIGIVKYNSWHQHNATAGGQAILEKRNNVYELAKAKYPERWSGETRNWDPDGEVTLNLEKAEQQETV